MGYSRISNRRKAMTVRDRDAAKARQAYQVREMQAGRLAGPRGSFQMQNDAQANAALGLDLEVPGVAGASGAVRDRGLDLEVPGVAGASGAVRGRGLDLQVPGGALPGRGTCAASALNTMLPEDGCSEGMVFERGNNFSERRGKKRRTTAKQLANLIPGPKPGQEGRKGEEDTDEEDLLPVYEAEIVDGATRRSNRTRTARKVVDYSMMVNPTSHITNSDDDRDDGRHRRDENKSRKESSIVRHKYESIFPDGYDSEAEEFDWSAQRGKTDGEGGEYNMYLRSKRGKYEIARYLLGDETSDEEEEQITEIVE